MSPALGLSIDGFSSARAIEAQARAAEAGGIRTLWLATHLFHREPVALASAALAATEKLRVALMAMSPYSVHPVYVAMAAATLDELYPGRILLSLGAGAPADLAAAGLEATRPLATLRETIEICRQLFSGEVATHDGEVFRVAGRRLLGAPCEIPLVLAASRRKMLALAGELADGVIISGATSVPFVRWCLEHVDRGAAGRPVERYGIVYTRVAGGTGDGWGDLRRTLGYILRGAHHRRNLDLGGAKLDQAAMRAAYAAEDWSALEALVGDAAVAAHAAGGTAEVVRARLGEYRAAGLHEVVLGGLTAPGDIRATLEAIADR